jgi:hypothetical protein
MYHLIVGVLAVAVFAALILAGSWFGGPVYTEARAKADYVANVQQAQQIDSALSLYKQDNVRGALGEDMVLVNNLISYGYLKDPPPGEWKVNAESLYKPLKIQSIEQCTVMNKVAGFDIKDLRLNDTSGARPDYQGCPPCNGEEVNGAPSQQLQDAVAFQKYPGCQFIGG